MEPNKKKLNTQKSLKFLVSHSAQKDQQQLPAIDKNLPKHSMHNPSHLSSRKDLTQKDPSSKSQHLQSKEQSSLPKKWQSIASQMNKRLHIQKLVYNRHSTTNMLTKYGGKVYRSESKGKKQQQERKESLQKSSIKNRPQTSNIHQNEKGEDSVMYKYLKHGERKNLRKRSKLPNNHNLISKQLSINKLFYENPVRKIGFNMQFEAKLTFQHLERLQAYKGLENDHYTNVNTRVDENPIIFYLKDSPFNANIITEKNEQSPLCISLFPQFFHSKLSSSNYIRQRYLQKMKVAMNNTYDPGVMGRMLTVASYPPFNMEAYVEVLRQFLGNFQQQFDPRWAQNILRRLKLPINSQQTTQSLRQIWDLFNKSIAMANLDYILKDQLYIQKFGISPFLPTKQITSKRILYHGGYSKFLYSGWSSYVKQGRKGLQMKLKKYNEVTQSVWTWLLNFENLSFYEIDFIKVLNRPLSIAAFKKVQERRVSQIKDFLKETWMRGIILIWQEHKFMQKSINEYKDETGEKEEMMREEIVKLRRELNEIKNASKSLGLAEHRILDSFQAYLHRVKSKQVKQSQTQTDLLSINGKDIESQGSKPRMGSVISPPLKELRTLINIHYSEMVQKSIKQLRALILDGRKSKDEERRAVLRLTLIVDRQNIKFRENEQEIIECFGQLIQQVFNHQVPFFGLKLLTGADGINQNQGLDDKQDKIFERRGRKYQCELKDIEPRPKTANLQSGLTKTRSAQKLPQAQEHQTNAQACLYPYIKIIDPLTNKDPSSLLTHMGPITYSYPFNHQRQINSLFFKLQQYYKESTKVLSLFDDFLPFIKLTTSKYIFHEQQNHAKTPQDILIKDLDMIQHYRQELAKIAPFQRLKLFEISCEEPLRQLALRISEVEYLTEQRYLNKIFDQIHDIQKKLNQIKNDIQSRQVKITNFDELEHQIQLYERQMLEVESCLKQLEGKVLFCLEVEKANSTLVLRYEQVVKKKKDLECQVRTFKTNLKEIRPELELRVKKECYDVGVGLSRLKEELEQIEGSYINAGEMQKFFSRVDTFGQKVRNYQRKMKEYLESAEYVVPVQDIDQNLSQFKTISDTYHNLSQFWKAVFAFQSYLHLNYKSKVYTMNLAEFQSILNQSQQISSKLSSETNTFIHKCQEHFLHKFQEDIDCCVSLRGVVGTLCNPKVQERHWKLYACDALRQMTLYELMKEAVSKEVTLKLQKMNEHAQMEFRVYDGYERIRKALKSKKIRIIDVNGSDVLDIGEASQTLDMLYNWKIECESLIQNEASSFFHGDIGKLLRVIDCSYEHLNSWREMEKSYVQITNYYVPNEQNIPLGNFALFDELRETHRKLIKSFDLNDSIWFISENIILGFYCQQILNKLSELQLNIFEFMTAIRAKYPRLYLLTDDELLSMMSSGAKIQKLVSKCFQHIQQIDIKDGAIERIGKNKHLKFLQPMYILDKLSMVYEWMPRFEQTIKKNMKDLYKTNFLSTIMQTKKPLGFADNYPLQLTILDESIEFTRMVEDSLGNLQPVAEIMRKKIYGSIKDSEDSTLTLLFIKFRETLSELIREQVTDEKDFTWYRHARFYCPQSLTHIQPKVAIMNQEYEYGFNYHELPQIVFQDHSFFGNTFIGQPQTGKKSIARYYAYITGMEMVVFDPETECEGSMQFAVNRLVDFFKIAAWTGAWLYLDRVERLSYEDLTVVSECLDSVHRALAARDPVVSILGDQIRLNRDAKVLMSFNSLQNQAIPSILIQKMRPMWVTKPNNTALLKLFLEAKTFSYEKISEFLGFCTWVEYDQEYQKCMIEWIRKETDKGCFKLNNLFARMAENGYLSRLKELIGENDKNTQLSNVVKNTALDLEDEISFVSYGGMLIYGGNNCGKTHDVLKVLEKYSHLYIDMRMFPQKHKAVHSITANFADLSPPPLFLLIRDGIQFYEYFHHLFEDNVRLIFVERDLRFLYFSLMQNIATLNYNQLTRKQYASLYPELEERIATHSEELALRNILGNRYDRIVQTLYLDFLVGLESLLQKQFPVSNVKISFAKLFSQLLKKGFGEEVSFLFACIWSFGNHLEESHFMNLLVDNFLPSDDRKRTYLVQSRLWNERMVEFINKINLWVKEGKIQSIFDLIPVKQTNNFSNNLTVNVNFALSSLDKRTVCMELGVIENFRLIRGLNDEWSIKVEAREWLSSIVKQWGKNKGVETMVLVEANQMNFPEMIDKILYRVRKNKSTYFFPKIRHIVIDDMHLHGVQNYVYLEHLASYKSVLFINKGRGSSCPGPKAAFKPKTTAHLLKKFAFNDSGPVAVEINHFSNMLTKIQLKDCGLTLGTKLNFTSSQDEKLLCLKIKQQQIQHIYCEFLRAFWTTHLIKDMGVGELLSIAHHFSKKVVEQFSLAHYRLYPFYMEQVGSAIFEIEKTPPMQNKFFWLKNPILLALKCQPTEMSTFCFEYLKIMADVVPAEVENILKLYYSLKLNIVQEPQVPSQRSLPSQQFLMAKTQSIPQLPSKQLQQASLWQFQQPQLQIPSQKSQQILSQKSQQIPSQQAKENFSNKDAPEPMQDAVLSKRSFKIPSLTPSQSSQNSKIALIHSVQQKINEIKLTKAILDSPEIEYFIKTSLQEEDEFLSHQITKRYQVQKVNSAIKLSHYLKEHIFKVYRQLRHNNLVLIGDTHSQREKICKIASKLLGWKIIHFQPSEIIKKIMVAFEGLQKDEKIIVKFRSSDITRKNLQDLFYILKYSDLQPWIKQCHESQAEMITVQRREEILSRLRFVLKVSLSTDESTQKTYETHPMLKTHFVNVWFETEREELISMMEELEEEKKVLRNGDTVITNDLEFEWKDDVLYLYEKYQLGKQFLICFTENYRANKESEYEKLQYYRKITSEMVVNIDRLSTYNSTIPTKVMEADEICYKIQDKKTKIRRDIEKLRQSKFQTEQQVGYIEQLLQDSENSRDALNDKMEKIMAPTAAKMDKIQKKLQTLDSSEFLKAKTFAKNDCVLLMVTVVNLLMEEDLLALHKEKTLHLTLPFTRNSLLSALKDVKKRYARPQTVKKLEQIELSESKIKETRDKIDELKSIGLKKVEKNGVIFKLLFEWIMLYYERKTIYDDQYMKFKYTFTNLQSELSNLSDNSNKIDKDMFKQEANKFEEDPNMGADFNKLQLQKLQSSVNSDMSELETSNLALKKQISQSKGEKIEEKGPKFKKIETQQRVGNDPLSVTKIHQESGRAIEDPTAIRHKLQQQKQKLSQLESRINQLNDQKQNLSQNEKALLKHKSYMLKKMQNLSNITSSLSNKEYMKNVSSNIASYFKNIPKISFLKTLAELKYNEYLDDERLEKYKLDLAHYFNVFSQNETVRLFKIKYGLHHMLEDEVECLYNVVSSKKALVVVEDAEEVIQEELVNVCQINGYHVIAVDYESLEEVEELLLKKINHYSKLLLLNNNALTSPFNSHNNQNQTQKYEIWPGFDDFIYRIHQELGSFAEENSEKQKKIIILNFTQPTINTEFYKQTNHGKVHVTYQRFMADLTSVFELVSNLSPDFSHSLSKLDKKDSFLQKLYKGKLINRHDPINSTAASTLQAPPKKIDKSTKELLAEVLKIHDPNQSSKSQIDIISKIPPEEIDLLINQQNSKMKHNLKNISTLTEIIIEKPYEVFQITDDEIKTRLEGEQTLIKEIEQNLSEISLIQEIIELKSKMSSNYKDQNDTNKLQIHEVGLPFFWIFTHLKQIAHRSQSPMFGVKQLYKEWLKCLKSLKSQNHGFFNFDYNAQIKFEINSENTEPKKHRKELEKGTSIISDVFRQNIQEIIKALIIKLGKNIVWQEKIELYRFLFVGFITFFISLDLTRAKTAVLRNIKELLELLSKADKMDKELEQKMQTIQKMISKDFKKRGEQKPPVQQGEVPENIIISFSVSSNQQQKQYDHVIWVLLMRVFLKGDQQISDLIEGLRTKNITKVYDQAILELYERLDGYDEVSQILKQVFNCKHHFQLIRSSSKPTSEQTAQKISGYSLSISLDFKESEISSSLIIIQENESAIGMVLENLRQKAKLYKRQWTSLIYNEPKSQETLKTLRKIIEKGKKWVYLANLSNSETHINSLRKIMYELDKMPKNPTIKIFIVIPSTRTLCPIKDLPRGLLYNKYDISKIIGHSDFDFEELAQFIRQSAFKLEQTNQTKEVFSIKTLQKIAATNKKMPKYSYTEGQIYESIIMGFRLLSEKHKLYNTKSLCAHFVNFLTTYEDLYKKSNRSGKIAYLNAIKFVYQHFKAFNEYSFDDVKNQVEISLHLKRQSLSLKKFRQAQPQLKSFSTKCSLLQQFTIDYVTLAQNQRASPIRVTGAKRKTLELPQQQTLKTFVKKAILHKANQTIAQSNQLYLKNLAINVLSNDIAQTYYRTGLNIHRRNPELYEKFQQKNLKSLLQKFQHFIAKHTPVYNSKLCKNSIRDEIYKIRSADELLTILNYVMSLQLKSFMRKNKPKMQRQGEKIQKDEYGFFVDKQKVQDSLNNRFLLLSVPSETSNQKIDSEATQSPAKLQNQAPKTLEFCVQELQKYFIENKVLKETFVLCLIQQRSKQQTRAVGKRYIEKGKRSALSKTQVENIMQRYMVILDYSGKNVQKVQKNPAHSPAEMVCLIQVFMK